MDFVITDSNVSKLMPSLPEAAPWLEAPRFVAEPGEEAKSPATLAFIWEWLASKGANRNSRIVNVGGGMVCDLGGFAAATFMRGIRYINVATTLLGAVDAAVGGKTAVNLGPLKNQAGAFWMPEQTIVSAKAFETLPRVELLSGLGEMLKYGLISSPGLYGDLCEKGLWLDEPAGLLPYVKECMAIKERITTQDPTEQGVRKVLNFGHTAGHAFESLALEKGKPVPHGVAVAHGLLVAMVLSHTVLGYPSSELYGLADILKDYFPALGTECKDNGRLVEFMRHDKKNTGNDEINFTLLSGTARPECDQGVSEEEVLTALDIYRDLTC